jgi:uncharacterized damage-inducible protein DinB
MTIFRPALTLAAITLLALPLAGQMQSNPLTAEALQAWGRAKDLILRSAEKMPEADYAFKPTPEVRSFGEIIAHIADAQNAICAGVKGSAMPTEPLAKTKTTKAALVEALRASDAACDATFEGMTDAAATGQVKIFGSDRSRLSSLYMLSFHGMDHYGNLVTYMRLKGLVPPSSEPRK